MSYNSMHMSRLNLAMEDSVHWATHLQLKPWAAYYPAVIAEHTCFIFKCMTCVFSIMVYIQTLPVTDVEDLASFQ